MFRLAIRPRWPAPSAGSSTTRWGGPRWGRPAGCGPSPGSAGTASPAPPPTCTRRRWAHKAPGRRGPVDDRPPRRRRPGRLHRAPRGHARRHRRARPAARRPRTVGRAGGGRPRRRRPPPGRRQRGQRGRGPAPHCRAGRSVPDRAAGPVGHPVGRRRRLGHRRGQRLRGRAGLRPPGRSPWPGRRCPGPAQHVGEEPQRGGRRPRRPAGRPGHAGSDRPAAQSAGRRLRRGRRRRRRHPRRPGSSSGRRAPALRTRRRRLARRRLPEGRPRRDRRGGRRGRRRRGHPAGGHRPVSAGPLVVVGDALLDRDVEGVVERVCPDAPVPVLDEQARRARPGGAALTAALAAARVADAVPESGSRRPVVLVTAVGADTAGDELRGLLERAGVEVVDLGLDGPTPEKIRLRTRGQSLLRLDRGGADGRTGPADPARAVLEAASAVVVADYGRGLAGRDDLRALLAAGRAPVVWDPHPRGPAPASSPPTSPSWLGVPPPPTTWPAWRPPPVSPGPRGRPTTWPSRSASGGLWSCRATARRWPFRPGRSSAATRAARGTASRPSPAWRWPTGRCRPKRWSSPSTPPPSSWPPAGRGLSLPPQRPPVATGRLLMAPPGAGPAPPGLEPAPPGLEAASPLAQPAPLTTRPAP